MASRNTDSVAQQGEFHASKPRDEPMTTSGHKPGVLASESDHAPEFSVQTLPAGSAPADRTFQPNPESEVPAVAQDGGQDPDAPQTSAPDTMPGATSGDVHTGLGHPGQGQSSAEMHHDDKAGRSKEGQALAGSAAAATNNPVDPHDPVHKDQRALDNPDAEVGRGNIGGPSAEERVPVSAEQVASGK